MKRMRTFFFFFFLMGRGGVGTKTQDCLYEGFSVGRIYEGSKFKVTCER